MNKFLPVRQATFSATITSIVLAIFFEVASADVAIMPTDISVNQVGNEAIIEIEADFGGGNIETALIHIEGTEYTIIGGPSLPQASNYYLPVFSSCLPDPLTGICALDELGGPADHIYIPPNQTQGLPGVIVAVGICAASYGIAHAFNAYACRNNGGIAAQEIGACGILSGSSVICNVPDETPPDEPDIPDEPPAPEVPPTPSTPPDCENALCTNLWDWNRSALGCLSINPDACF